VRKIKTNKLVTFAKKIKTAKPISLAKNIVSIPIESIFASVSFLLNLFVIVFQLSLLKNLSLLI